MEAIDTQTVVDGKCYAVYHDFKFLEDEGIFIIHLQGDHSSNRKARLNIVKHLRDLGKSLYFCESAMGVFKNHMERVGKFSDNNEPIYRFIWKGQK